MRSPDRYYKVSVKKGHVGAGQYEILTLYIKAPDFRAAMDIAKNMPAVKHNSTSVVQSLKLIKETEYEEGLKTSAYDRTEN